MLDIVFPNIAINFFFAFDRNFRTEITDTDRAVRGDLSFDGKHINKIYRNFINRKSKQLNK